MSARLQVALLRPRAPTNLSNSLLSRLPGGTVCGGGSATGALASARRSSSSGSAWLPLLLLWVSSGATCSRGWLPLLLGSLLDPLEPEAAAVAASSPAGWLLTGMSVDVYAGCDHNVKGGDSRDTHLICGADSLAGKLGSAGLTEVA
jgi:hypothetical protein